MPLLGGGKIFLYPSPLNYRVIPELIYELGATIFFATNTFLKGYAHYAHPYDLNTLNYVIAGAEKLHVDTMELWMHKYGLRILQGYGVTEASPVISVNNKMLNKSGTVGRLVSDMEYYIKPVDGIENGGLLVVRGPNIMQGYLSHHKLGQIEAPATERGLGWYDTGDIVVVDDDGFITILGRAKRFAKVGGEMVSLSAVEELASLTWPNMEHAAFTLHDEHKGERVILITNQKNPIRKELQKIAKSIHVSELVIPKIIIYIEKIPVLSTGKTDYVSITKLGKSYLEHKKNKQLE
jgi:acyl-[acyl-carrier-protein]-phospholipid O-acyltransferase/long-chain-fatty-acid--[acyl-carrier-protein] ligase